jgi:import inner membrane translocase subunit TIM22
MESCYAKTVMSGGAGFALGGLFGVFMASVSPTMFDVGSLF